MKFGTVFKIIHSVHCVSNHLHIQIHAYKLYKTGNFKFYTIYAHTLVYINDSVQGFFQKFVQQAGVS